MPQYCERAKEPGMTMRNFDRPQTKAGAGLGDLPVTLEGYRRNSRDSGRNLLKKGPMS
jgi:hypothetical protein